MYFLKGGSEWNLKIRVYYLDYLNRFVVLRIGEVWFIDLYVDNLVILCNLFIFFIVKECKY